MESNNSNFQQSNNSNFQQSNDPNAWYEKTSVVVILCILFFPVGLYALWKNSSISKGSKIGVTSAIIVILLIASSGDSDKASAATASTEVQQEENSVAETPVEETNWQFEEEVDKMTSQKTKYASIEANEELQFEFPYEGGSIATLVIRKQDGIDDVYLTISKGQFNGGVEDGQLRIKFDDKQPETFTFSEPSDGSSDAIYIGAGSEDSIISQLKNSKKIIIETEFFKEGTRQMEFDVAGFKWE